ncbi:MAG: aminotransferase class I/II-fold pyridoxal phosphate-dependent enzyme [Lentisphaerae bacterium]|nr:aminotransferase class I/II-fold pyridoxal phosphate-dependent enzyme [Lentisphaerota bacterium]
MEKLINSLSQAELTVLKNELEAEYSEYASRNLALNMARGKPSGELLNHNMDVLETLENPFAADGTDARNYGILEGLPEMRKFFGEVLNLDPERIIVGGNSSLTLMYDSIARLFIFGTCGYPAWRTLPKLKFLCPSPGYDRHFAITQEFGFEMIPVPMTENGPDMDVVENLVASDEAIKGIWCVPLYSNPQGVCYSDETVARLGKMKTAAPDFKIFWDNAYGVHHIYEEVKLADIFAACEAGGNPDRAYYFFSTSKITFPGAGVAMMAASHAECKEILKRMGIQTIGSDKLNQLRTLRTLKDAPTLKKHMAELADILRPKFEIVLNTLDSELRQGGYASWIAPRGGYFVSLDTMDGCAKKTLELAKNAGVTMTGAGATFPYKNDPRDRNIRIAPTYPTNDELQIAMKCFCVCVKLAAVKKLCGEF